MSLGGMGLTVPDRNNSINLFGMMITLPSLFNLVIRFKIRWRNKILGAYLNALSHRLIMFNTLWGLERTSFVPPNYVITGPLIS
jgi:hypothetical protein